MGPMFVIASSSRQSEIRWNRAHTRGSVQKARHFSRQ